MSGLEVVGSLVARDVLEDWEKVFSVHLHTSVQHDKTSVLLLSRSRDDTDDQDEVVEVIAFDPCVLQYVRSDHR